MIESILAILAAGLAIWFIGAIYLRGKDLSVFDSDPGQSMQKIPGGAPGNAEHQAVLASIAAMNTSMKGVPRAQYLGKIRSYFDGMFANPPADVRFIPTEAAGVPAEWVMAPGVDTARRTLYIHGGAFTLGSPRSHRVITSRFSEISGGAVLAIDYRLMPEHPRMACIEDCRKAYRWMLENGPEGAAPARVVFVAGDSAGGNLTLSLIAWLRDQGLRAPDAAVALSPATDATLSSPSFLTNLPTDHMLGPMLKPLTRVPRSVLMWTTLMQLRMRPSHPLISPVFGDLSNLPPLLIHASETEMLFDDSRRYVNKAVAAGSPVRLQTWNHVEHVWHLFDPALSEARQAFEEIRKFLAAHSEGKAAG